MSTDLYECYDCGEMYPVDELNYVNGNDVCDDCLDDYRTCDQCGDYAHRCDTVTDGNTTLCRCCYDYYYYRCNTCDSLIHGDTVMWDGDDPYCEDCYNDRDHIHDHDYTPDLHFHGIGDGYYGVEVEIDDGNDRDSTARDLYNIAGYDGIGPRIYCKYDGSLSNGFEIVSHPMTLEYHMSARMPWDEIFDECIQNGWKSHDTDTCGLHIHASRELFGNTTTEIDLTAAKIMLLFTKFWDSHIINFTRRRSSELRDWARRPDEIIDVDDDEPAVLKKVGYEKNGTRYKALNLKNKHTIEFRLFKGTLKHSTFIACLQFVDYLIKFARKTELKRLNDYTWTEIFQGAKHKELNNYLKKRGLM